MTLETMTFPETLAAVNATLNATAGILLFMGYRAIKAKKIERHKKFMISAFVTSCIFLVSYLTRISIAGDTPFQGQGPIRYVYFAILISHVCMAMVVVPFALRALYLGLKRKDIKHKKTAKFAFPIWMYVSVTGVIVYLMLYQWH